MNESRLHCLICSTPLASGATLGLCPQCQSKQAGESTVRLDGIAPTTEQTTTHQRLHYFGDYELIDEIARGGMGVVYRARQVSLNRTVAVKMILSGQFAGDAEIKRFRVEAEAAANLQHPNIVAIHEIGEHEGRHYFSMDFIAGQNLAAYAHNHPLTPPEIARLLKLLAEAVHFAHQRGTLHRDLKPQNVLIDAQGQPHITDFGLAKQWDATKPVAAASELTEVGDVMGSPSYMAPEQAAGRTAEIGPSTDVYALGAILYELLTDQPPHRGASKHETIAKVLGDEPTSPHKLKPNIPKDLEVICLKCLEKNPQQRYSTARQLAEEFDRFLAGEPIQAKPVAASRKIMAWALRHPWAISGLASLIILVLGLSTYGLWEKTLYLKWLAEHPRQIPVNYWPAYLETECGGRTLLVVCGIIIASGLCAGDLQLRRSVRLQPEGQRLVVYGLIALAHIVSVIYMVVKIVRICIWADAPGLLMGLFIVLAQPALWGGLQVLWQCLRAAQLSRSGVEPPPDFLTNPVRRPLTIDGPISTRRLWLADFRLMHLRQEWAQQGRQARLAGIIGPMLLATGVLMLLSLWVRSSERPGWIIGAWISMIFLHCLAGLINPHWTAYSSQLAQTTVNAARYQYAMAVLIIPGFFLLFSLLPRPPGLLESVPVGLTVGVLLVLWRYRRIVHTNNQPDPKPPA